MKSLLLAWAFVFCVVSAGATQGPQTIPYSSSAAGTLVCTPTTAACVPPATGCSETTYNCTLNEKSAAMVFGPLSSGSTQTGGTGAAPVVTPQSCTIGLPVSPGANTTLIGGGTCGYTATCGGDACSGINGITSWAITAQSTADAFAVSSGGILQGGSAAGSVTTGSYTATVTATNSTGTSPGVVQTVDVFAPPVVAALPCSIKSPISNGSNVVLQAGGNCQYTATCAGGACSGANAISSWAVTTQTCTNCYQVSSVGILQGGTGFATVTNRTDTVTITATNAGGTSPAVAQTVIAQTVPAITNQNFSRTLPMAYPDTLGTMMATASPTSWAITAVAGNGTGASTSDFAVSSGGVLTTTSSAPADITVPGTVSISLTATNATGTSSTGIATVTIAGVIPVVQSHACTITLPVTNLVNVSPTCQYTATCAGVACTGANAITNWAITSQSTPNSFFVDPSAGILQGGSASGSITAKSYTVTAVATNTTGTSPAVTQTVTVQAAPVVATLNCNINSPITNGVNVSPTCQYTATCSGVACTGANAVTSWAIASTTCAGCYLVTNAGILQGGANASTVVNRTDTLGITATNAVGTSAVVNQQVVASSLISPGFTTVALTSPSGSGTSCSAAGSCVQYVSFSMGSDSNACTLASPCKTVQKGWASLRNGKPDQLLLNCNDTWTLGASDGINVDANTSTVRNGISPTGSIGGTITGPTLISYYDPAGGTCSGRRPLIQTNSASNGGTGLFLNMNHCHSGTCPTLNNVAVIGVELYAYQRDPSSVNFVAAESAHAYDGFDIIGGGTSTWVLLEDNKISYYNDGFSVDATGNGSGLCPAGTSVTLCNGSLNYRRNIIQHTYGYSNGGGIVTGTAQCIYTDHAVSALLDSNYLVYCGWDNTLGAPQSVTIASSVITWPKANYAFNALPFVNGATMVFQNTSGGVTAGTQYYIINANSAAGTFQVATSYPSSTPVTISNGSNVMENVDVSQNVRNHNLYGAYAMGNGFTLTNNIAAWGRDVMDRPGGGTAGTTGLGVVSGNFLTFVNIGISYGTFSGCCSGGGNEGPFTVLNMTGNVISQAGYQMFPGTFTDPGNNGAWGGDIEQANGTGACSGGTINFSNNLYSKMGTASSTALRISDHTSGTVNNICVQNMIIFSSAVGISPNGGTGNVLTPQTCVDLTGANTGCADEPFPTPTRDILTYDHDKFGTTCTAGSGWNTTLNNTCWLDMHSREVARGLQSWPSNLAASAIVSYMMAGFGITCPSAKWC